MRITLAALLLVALTTPALAQTETARQAYDRAYRLEHETRDHAAAATAYRAALAHCTREDGLALRCRVRLAACLLALGKDDAARAALKTPLGKREAPVAVKKPDPAVRARLAGRKVTLDFSSTPLVDVLQFLAEMSQTPMILDRRTVPKAVDAKVTVRLNQLELDKALTLILGLHDLAWTTRCDAVIVSSKAGLARFPDRGPVGVPGKFVTLDFSATPTADVCAFIAQVCGLDVVVNDASLRDRKVTLSVKNHPLPYAIGLVCGLIGAEARVENGVVVLRDLDRARKPAAAAEGKKPAAAHPGLQRKVTLDFSATPLGDVLVFLSETTEVPMVLDEPARHAASKITMRLDNQTVERALALIVDQAGLTSALRAGAIVVARAERLAGYAARGPALGPRGKRTLTLDFAAAPAKDVVDFLRNTAGVNVVLAGDALQTRKVTLRVKGLSVSRVFALVAGQIGAKTELREGVLVLTAR